MHAPSRKVRHPLKVLATAIVLTLGSQLPVRAETLNLQTATIADLNKAFAGGKLTSEKVVAAYLERIASYDKKGPTINSVITLNPKALEIAKTLDAERKAGKVRGPLHGIPVVLKDNFDTFDMPTTGGSQLLEGSIPPDDAFVVKKLRDAGAIILAKVNLSEWAGGGGSVSGATDPEVLKAGAVPNGSSTSGGQTLNPHDLTRGPAGSSGGTGAAIAAVFAQFGLGTDTGGSVRGPSSVNGIVGLKPTHGLLSRDGIIPLALTFDTGGPMARSVYDVALALGFMTGVDPKDPLTSTSAGLFYKDYTRFLNKDALKGVRIGVIRDYTGTDPEVDRVFNESLQALTAQGAILVDQLNFPAIALQNREVVMNPVRAEVKDNYVDYLSTLRPGFPRTVTELGEQGLKLTKPKGDFLPHPSVFTRFKELGERPPITSLSYTSAKHYGMKAVQGAVLGLLEEKQLDALVYPTRPAQPEMIDPETPNIVERPRRPSLTSIANVTQFPDVIVPAGITNEKMPVTISFFGPAYSEPRLLAYAYAYEQATHKLVLPATTPALPGEKFDY